MATLLFCEFVRGKLVVDSLTELMIGQGDDLVYDVQRINKEGDMVNKTLEESECEGVMEEIQTWEVITIEEGKEMSNQLEVVKLIDLTQDAMQITNVREPCYNKVLNICHFLLSRCVPNIDKEKLRFTEPIFLMCFL